jgi:hypothetical protein
VFFRRCAQKPIHSSVMAIKGFPTGPLHILIQSRPLFRVRTGNLIQMKQKMARGQLALPGGQRRLKVTGDDYQFSGGLG